MRSAVAKNTTAGMLDHPATRSLRERAGVRVSIDRKHQFCELVGADTAEPTLPEKDMGQCLPLLAAGLHPCPPLDSLHP
jgi:hypothetical protein